MLGLLYMLFSEVGEVHQRVLDHPKIQYMLDDSRATHYDVTFVSPLFNEMGLYFGRKFSSSVILYMAPVSSSLLSASMGHFDHPVIAAQVHSMEGQQVAISHTHVSSDNCTNTLDRLHSLQNGLAFFSTEDISIVCEIDLRCCLVFWTDSPSFWDRFSTNI